MDKQIFEIFDEDGNGHISFKEFKKIWTNLGLSRTDIELLEIFNSIDIDGNGTIEYNELKDFFDTQFEKNDLDSINEAFSIIDNNNSRYISFSEFETIIDKMKLDISLSHIKTCFYKYDYNKDHKISLTEFTKLIADSNTNMSVFSIIGNMLSFIDQSETNYILRDKTQIKRKELLNNYRWLRTISPFSILSRGRIYQLLQNMKKMIVNYNETFIEINDKIQSCFIIFSGECKLTSKHSKLGNINEYCILKSGTILCLDDLLLNNIFNYRVISNTSTILWSIPINDFKHILSLDKEFKNTILNLSNQTIELNKYREIKLNDVKNNIFKQSQIDKFKHTRGFVRWIDDYPIKINPDSYKLPNLVNSLPSRKYNIKNIKKKPYKSYSKYGKSLEKVII